MADLEGSLADVSDTSVFTPLGRWRRGPDRGASSASLDSRVSAVTCTPDFGLSGSAACSSGSSTEAITSVKAAAGTGSTLSPNNDTLLVLRGTRAKNMQTITLKIQGGSQGLESRSTKEKWSISLDHCSSDHALALGQHDRHLYGYRGSLDFPVSEFELVHLSNGLG